MTSRAIAAGAIRDAVGARESRFLERLRSLVDCDSGSTDQLGVQRLTLLVEEMLAAAGLASSRLPAGELDVLVGRRPGDGPRIMLVAHMDTVFDPGTAAARPFSIDGTIARGPGVADDKAGIVAAIVAAEVLEEIGSPADVTLVFTPDEEIGSPGSKAVLEQLATEADVALVLEAARADGSLVSARKGGADLLVRITGRAAHAGVEPEKGVHAGLQLAHTVIGLQGLNALAAGVTVNAGVLQAGTRPNVVPAEAIIWVDVRATSTVAFESAMAAAERIARTPYVEGVDVEVVREFVAPPMEATPGTLALADLAIQLAKDLGFDVRHVATGGIGDANTLAACGLPVLDGLAPVGGDDHAPTEWLDLTSVVPRVALLAALCHHLALG